MHAIKPCLGFGLLLGAGLLVVVDQSPLWAQADTPAALTVVWTSGDPDVAQRVCLMYTHAARRSKWFDDVELVVWGPSARLLAADKDLQAKIKQMQKSGVVTRACIVCADSYGVTEQLRTLGLEVKPMGKPLSNTLQSGRKVLTF